MHHKFEAMEPKTRFGKWMHSRMFEQHVDCTDVAKKLRITKQTVAAHVGGHHEPSYPFVIAYCSILGGNPEGVWKLVELDKEGS